MDESTIKVRAGVAFALAIVCVGVALFILSYTLGGSAPEAEVPQPASNDAVPAE